MSPLDPLRLGKVRLAPGDWYLSPGYNGPLSRSCPKIITIHDLNHIDRPENGSFAKTVFYKTILTSVARSSAAILTVSDFSKSRIVEWFDIDESRVFNVGNGVSEVFFDRPVMSGGAVSRPYFICVSNRKGHKNEASLFRAFASCKASKEADLYMTGEPDELTTKVINSLRLDGRVRFVGKVSDLELADYYRQSAALLFPSLYEGFGLPILEAFACGVPVVTSNLTSMPEIAGSAALLVDPHDCDDIARGIDLVYFSQELRQNLIDMGRSRAAHFSWDGVAARIKDAVGEVNKVGAAGLLKWE